jgi:hypothetical protein
MNVLMVLLSRLVGVTNFVHDFVFDVSMDVQLYIRLGYHFRPFIILLLLQDWILRKSTSALEILTPTKKTQSSKQNRMLK